jgi:hypothetical protein
MTGWRHCRVVHTEVTGKADGRMQRQQGAYSRFYSFSILSIDCPHRRKFRFQSILMSMIDIERKFAASRVSRLPISRTVGGTKVNESQSELARSIVPDSSSNDRSVDRSVDQLR